MNQSKMDISPDQRTGWKLVPIREVAYINPKVDKSAIPDKLMVSFVPMQAVGAGDGTIDVSNLRPASEVKKGFTNFQEGDVLFAKITPCMENGKMAVVPKVASGYGFGSTEFHVLRPKNGLDTRYLYYFVSSQNVRREAAHNMTGAVGQKRVPTSFIADLEIPLVPADQQRRVVAEIEKQFSRLDEAVANLKRVKANLKRYKAAVLKAAVEGKLTEEWRKGHNDIEHARELLARAVYQRKEKWQTENPEKKYKQPAEPDTDLPELPERWVWSRTDQLFNYVTSGSRGWANYYSESGPAFLRMGNLDHDTINLDLSDIQRVKPPKGSEGTRTRVVPGDILISITADVGMIGLVPTEFEEAYINQHVALARPVPAVNQVYLAWYLACKSGQDQLQRLQRGATKVGLGLEDIKSVNVPLPPIKEQHEIVAEIDRGLSIVNDLETKIEMQLSRAGSLGQTILQAAFAGKIAELSVE